MIGIYGANGFIGRHLLRRFAALGWPVRAVSRRFDRELVDSLPGGVEFMEADLADPPAMAASLEGVDVVVQLVSTSSPASQNRHAGFDIQENVLPQVAFMQAAVDAGVGRYVFASSGGSVYGPQGVTPTPEHATTAPICSHGLTKLTIEHYLRMHAIVDDLDIVILRISNVFGPGQAFRKGQGLIPAMLNRVSQGLPVQVVGDGTTVRDYVFVDDVVEAFEAALNRTRAGGAFNVGSGQGRSVNDVVAALELEIGTSLERVNIPARRTDTPVSVLDVTAAQRALGWRPRTSFHEGLRRTVASWRSVTRRTDTRRAA